MAMQVLVVQPENESIPTGTAQQLIKIGCEVSNVSGYDAAIDILKDKSFGAILLSQPQPKQCTPEHQVAFELFVKQIESKRIATILYAQDGASIKPNEGTLVDHVQNNITAPELKGRIAMIERYQGVIGGLETQLLRMEQLGKLLNQHLRELDQEMELAGRLQRDFLPQLSGRVGNVEYASIYRPVTWISGDMFDVLPIDKKNTGFYIADAVGHGMASGLLAMYMKRAIVPAKIQQDQLVIAHPTEVLETLNKAMVDQALPDCQFITACYMLINHDSRTLEFARAGHPHPILIKRNGHPVPLPLNPQGKDHSALTDSIERQPSRGAGTKCLQARFAGEARELITPGGLLGLSESEEYPSMSVPLEVGDKIIVFTDGFEPFLTSDTTNNKGDSLNLDLFKSMSSMNIHEVISELDAMMDVDDNWNKPPDDMTVMGLEILS